MLNYFSLFVADHEISFAKFDTHRDVVDLFLSNQSKYFFAMDEIVEIDIKDILLPYIPNNDYDFQNNEVADHSILDLYNKLTETQVIVDENSI